MCRTAPHAQWPGEAAGPGPDEVDENALARSTRERERRGPARRGRRLRLPLPWGRRSLPERRSGGRGGGIGIIGLLDHSWPDVLLRRRPEGHHAGRGPGGDATTFPDIRLPQSRPDTTNFPVPDEQQGPPLQRPQTTSEDDLKQFVAVVLGDTEDVWQETLRAVRPALHRPDARAVQRRCAFGVRPGNGADGPVLLPDR